MDQIHCHTCRQEINLTSHQRRYNSLPLETPGGFSIDK